MVVVPVAVVVVVVELFVTVTGHETDFASMTTFGPKLQLLVLVDVPAVLVVPAVPDPVADVVEEAEGAGDVVTVVWAGTTVYVTAAEALDDVAVDVPDVPDDVAVPDVDDDDAEAPVAGVPDGAATVAGVDDGDDGVVPVAGCEVCGAAGGAADVVDDVLAARAGTVAPCDTGALRANATFMIVTAKAIRP